MNNKIVLENSLKSQEVNTLINEKNFIVRVETNLQQLPIWSPIPKRGTVFKPSKTIYLQPETLKNGDVVECKIEISPSAQYGYPTVKTQEYWFILQHLWHEQGQLQDGKIYFSRRQIIEDILGQKNGSNPRKALDLSLLQLAYTGFGFNYVFYDKEQDITHSEIRHFHLVTDLYLTEKKKKDEIIHEKCFITLHPLIVSNLQNNYYKPILLSVVTNLKSDIGKLLYTKVDTHFSHYNKYEISTTRFFKEHGLEGKSYSRPGKRKQLLEKGANELIGKLTSSGATITQYEFQRIANGKDWKILVYSDGKKEKKKKEIIELTQNKEKKVTQEKPKQEQTTQVISSDLQEVITKFETTFGVAKYTPNQQAVTIIKKLLKNHSIKVVKSWIYDAQQRCKETNYNPKTINGIKKFIEPYFTELEARKKREERERVERSKKALEDQRFDHEKEYSQEYRNYISKRIKILIELHPDEYLEFLTSEKAQLSELEEKAEAASNRTSRKLARFHIEHFKKENNKILRAVKFFQNTECSLPDFWEWDKKINPDSFDCMDAIN